MKGWALEIGKMAMYMTFPVAMFHYFNQPEYFEKWVTKTRREVYPPESKQNREEIGAVIQELRAKNDLAFKRALEDIEARETIQQ